MKIIKQIITNFKSVSEDEDRFIEGYVSTKDKDRVDDVVIPEAFKKSMKDFMKNPIVLFNHNLDEPIGKVLDYKIDNKGLWVKAQISKSTEKANEIWQLIKEGIIKSFSFWFRIKDADVKEVENGNFVRIIKDLDIFEVSVVTVPANPNAVFEVKSINNELYLIYNKPVVKLNNDNLKDLKNYFKFEEDKEDKVKENKTVKKEQKDIKETKEVNKEEGEQKAVPKYRDYPILDENVAWDKDKSIKQLRKWASSDGSGDKDKIDWKKYLKGFFWYDANDPENFTSYKLPYVYIVDGQPKVPIRAIYSVYAVLNGARGGVNIPDDDKEKIKKQLKKYYEKAGKDYPEDNKNLQEMLNKLDEIKAKLIEYNYTGTENDLISINIQVKTIDDLIGELKSLIDILKENKN